MLQQIACGSIESVVKKKLRLKCDFFMSVYMGAYKQSMGIDLKFYSGYRIEAYTDFNIF